VDITTPSGVATGTVTVLSLSGSTPTLTVTTAAGFTYSNVQLSQITAVR
jgi:flagellar basal-body rod modification protein FlgD